jgi:hypothetical protein
VKVILWENLPTVFVTVFVLQLEPDPHLRLTFVKLAVFEITLAFASPDLAVTLNLSEPEVLAETPGAPKLNFTLVTGLPDARSVHLAIAPHEAEPAT